MKKVLNKKRILILPSWYPPAGGGFFRDHAEALGEEYEVHVVTKRLMGITRNSINTICRAYKRTTVTERGVLVQREGFIKLPLLEKISIKLWISAYIRQIHTYIKKYGQPDGIIAHSAIWAGAAALKISGAYRIPLILVEHRSRFASHDPLTHQYFKKWYIPSLKDIFAGADSIVTVSESLFARISEIEPEAKSKMIVIPNLVKTDYFTLPDKKSNPEPFVFISVAYLEEVKGLRYLLEAFQHFTGKVSGSFELRIAGRGSLEKDLKKYCKHLGLERNVRFLGFMSREGVRAELQNSHIFILPSITEAFGVALIEAMSVGLPVIATKSGGPATIVTKETGLLVPARNPEELANAMEKLYIDHHSYDKRKIREYIVTNFSPQVILSKWHHLIEEIIYE